MVNSPRRELICVFTIEIQNGSFKTFTFKGSINRAFVGHVPKLSFRQCLKSHVRGIPHCHLTMFYVQEIFFLKTFMTVESDAR